MNNSKNSKSETDDLQSLALRLGAKPKSISPHTVQRLKDLSSLNESFSIDSHLFDEMGDVENEASGDASYTVASDKPPREGDVFQRLYSDSKVKKSPHYHPEKTPKKSDPVKNPKKDKDPPKGGEERESEDSDTETEPDPYEEFIHSPDFMISSPIYAIQECLGFATLSTPSTSRFWASHQTFFKKLIDSGEIIPLKLMMIEIPKGISHLASYMNGFQSGMSLNKSEENRALIEGLGGIIDSLKIVTRETRDESIAHQQQTMEFLSQLKNSSDLVAGFQRMVEKVQLIALRLDTSPLPLPHSDPFEPKTSRTPSTTSSIVMPVGTIVKYIDGPGTYTCTYLTVKAGDDSIQSIDIHIPEMTALLPLQGQHISFAFKVLNRSLIRLQDEGAKDKHWLESLMSKGREAIIEFLQRTPAIPHQWTRKDFDI